MIIASENGHKEIVNMLIQNKADVNYQSTDGYTALMHGLYA